MNLYIFTEENPKVSSVKVIISEYAIKRKVSSLSNGLKIIPIFKNNQFQHIYEVIGTSVEGIEHIYCVIFTGCSSTIDFMVFESKSLPTPKNNKPIMLIEETKTNDCESGNAVYQRIIKFVYAKQYYPSASLYMLYNEEYNVNNSRDSVSNTNVFGTRMMLTMGIKILGRSLDETIFRPFTSLNEFVNAKSNIHSRGGHTPLSISMENDCVKISALLSKPREKGNICHDPNIGFVGGVSYIIREIFGYSKPIILINHGVSQKNMNRARNNKLLSLCSVLNISFENLTMNTHNKKSSYWSDKKTSEKYGSIFMDKYLTNCGFETIYENHAGCERSYFKTDEGFLTFPKQINNETFYIPDFISINREKKVVYLVEAKQIQNINNGIEELNNYDIIEEYINNYYSGYVVYRYVCLYGGDSSNITNECVGFIMTSDGRFSFNENILI